LYFYESGINLELILVPGRIANRRLPPMSDFARQLQDYRITTAEILYRMPDHPSVLQSFVWQELDLAPAFPTLRKFLDFWEKNLDGRLFKVRVASCDLIRPAEFRLNAHIATLH
jgi:uncharacterized protein Usg